MKKKNKKNKKNNITYTKRPAKGVLHRLLDNINPDSLEKTRQEMLQEIKKDNINEKGSN